MFIFISVIFYSQVYGDKDDCELHQWSKDFLNNDLVCMECNKRIKNDNL